MNYSERNTNKKLTIIISILISCFIKPYLADGQIIPASRKVQWNPGLPEGIPQISLPVVNILEFEADPTGKQNTYTAFAEALNKLPASGGVIYFPEGTYYFTKGMDIYRSNVVIRGEGHNKTNLLFKTDEDCIQIASHKRGAFQDVISGYQKGSTKIIVADASEFQVGEFAELQQQNDSVLMYTNPNWDQPWSKYSVGQIFRIEKIDKRTNTLFFNYSLHLNYQNELMPQIRPIKPVTYCGIEDLYIERIEPADRNTISFSNAGYCWVKNIESNHTFRTHVIFSASLSCEVRESYFHHSFDYGGGGHAYGVEVNRHSTNVLVEDNIFDSLRHAFMIQVGANGNVYAYNYSDHPVQGTGETDLNQGWIPPDISIHGHYPFMNLFEGNVVHEIGIGDYWGPAGPGNTYFRNNIVGEGIFYYDHSHQQTIIGNITPQINYGKYEANLKLEHGNVIDGTIQWNDTIDNKALPDSYYLDSKPGFFEGMPWPAFGPDVNGFTKKIPAQIRYEEMMRE